HVIDVHRREAALVVMGIPERKLLAAMRCAERVVDVENLLRTRFDRRAELIDKSRGEPRRLRLAGRVLQTTDRRLRGQRRTALRTAPDRDLHQRVVPQPVEVDGILVAASASLSRPRTQGNRPWPTRRPRSAPATTPSPPRCPLTGTPRRDLAPRAGDGPFG